MKYTIFGLPITGIFIMIILIYRNITRIRDNKEGEELLKKMSKEEIDNMVKNLKLMKKTKEGYDNRYNNSICNNYINYFYSNLFYGWMGNSKKCI